jgi:Protein of unknown function (DUF3574)
MGRAPRSSGPSIGLSAEYRAGDHTTGLSPIRSDMAKEPVGSAVKARSLVERAWPITCCRRPLAALDEPAILACEARYSNGEKYQHHHHRGSAGRGGKEAQRGTRQAEGRSHGIRRASRGLVLACVFVVAALGLGLAQANGETPAVSTCAPNGTVMSKVELYFGTAGNGHRPVSNTDWAHFVEAQIGPRFPGGFTVLKGQGRWRTSRGAILKETSHVLIVWYRRAPSVEARIEAIRAAYRRQFSQESVMRADSSGCVSFK